MPYRVRRRIGTLEARHELTNQISKVQADLAYHQALLQIECPDIAAKYIELVRAAKIQAGGLMQDAWREPVLGDDAAMNLGVRYARDQIDAARGDCVIAMRQALAGWREKWREKRKAKALPTANSDRPTGSEG